MSGPTFSTGNIYNCSILCIATNIVYRFSKKQHDVSSGVRLPNHYTHTKLEKVLLITSKNIRHFINAIYYS